MYTFRKKPLYDWKADVAIHMMKHGDLYSRSSTSTVPKHVKEHIPIRDLDAPPKEPVAKPPSDLKPDEKTRRDGLWHMPVANKRYHRCKMPKCPRQSHWYCTKCQEK